MTVPSPAPLGGLIPEPHAQADRYIQLRRALIWISFLRLGLVVLALVLVAFAAGVGESISGILIAILVLNAIAFGAGIVGLLRKERWGIWIIFVTAIVGLVDLALVFSGGGSSLISVMLSVAQVALSARLLFGSKAVPKPAEG